ncbi:MAG: hypothetical protein WA364_18980 [Candidatus Nitrosopolaris sp.]
MVTVSIKWAVTIAIGMESGSGIFAEVDITRPLQAIPFDKHAASRPPEIPVT